MKKWHGVLLGAALAASVLTASFQWSRAQAAQRALSARYDSDFFSALDALSTMETDLSKTAAASSPGVQALLLGRISTQAQSAAEDLAALGSGAGSSEGGMKFLSQAADYAQTLSVAAAEGRTLTDGDLKQLEEIRKYAGELSKALSQNDSFRFDDSFPAEEVSGIEYPTLLYDGPFSDGVITGEARMLSSLEEISQAQALEKAAQFVGEERVIAVKETAALSGPIPCYGVEIQTRDLTLLAQITKKGGKVLWMSPESAGFESVIDLEESRLHALAFLKSRGFGEMEMRYYQVYDGLAVMNFAAVQEGVLLYPDLVKVQVRLDSGEIVGIEANHFWMNHYERENLTAKIEMQQAKMTISPRLSVGEGRLCVIPQTDGLGKNEKEQLCWEFSARGDGAQFLIYVNAENGKEEKVLKIMENDWGWIAQ